MDALQRLFSSRLARFVVFMKCTPRGKLPRQDDYATPITPKLSPSVGFSVSHFLGPWWQRQRQGMECAKITNHVPWTAYWLDLSGFLHVWWLVPWCSRILISIWYFLQLSVGWWQNNLFARTLRSRSDFLTREDFQPGDSAGESFGWEPLFALPLH